MVGPTRRRIQTQDDDALLLFPSASTPTPIQTLLSPQNKQSASHNMSFSGFGSSNSSTSSTKVKPPPQSLFGPAAAATNMQSRTQQAIMQQIQQEAAMSNARQLVSSINSNCFDKCVPKPGASLSSSEDSCMSACMEKYMAAWNTAAKTYTGRLAQERQQQNLGAGLGL